MLLMTGSMERAIALSRLKDLAVSEDGIGRGVRSSESAVKYDVVLCRKTSGQAIRLTGNKISSKFFLLSCTFVQL